MATDTATDTKPCGRCGDTDRFRDGPDSVCSTCGLTRWNAHKDTNVFGLRSDLAAESWVERLARIKDMQRANGLTPSATVIVPTHRKTA